MSKIKVWIDPGHGGRDSGALSNNKKYEEKTIVLDISLKVKKYLESTNMFEVMLSRTNDIFCTLDYRSSNANKWGADIFVSIHCNSADNLNAKGLEVFAFKEQYKKLAQIIYNSLKCDHLFTLERGVKFENFHVLRETKMSACLIECGFISNDEDLNLLLNKKEEFAYSITKGICNYFNINFNLIKKGESSPQYKTFYRVCTGSFIEKKYAEEQKRELESKGYNVNIYPYNVL